MKEQKKLVEGRSSHQRCSVKKGALRNFAKLTGKHICQSLFFNKVEISRNTFFTEHVWATAFLEGLSRIINLMKDLKTLGVKHNIENQLY